MSTTTKIRKTSVSLGIPENEPIEEAEKSLDLLTQTVMKDQ